MLVVVERRTCKSGRNRLVEKRKWTGKRVDKKNGVVLQLTDE